MVVLCIMCTKDDGKASRGYWKLKLEALGNKTVTVYAYTQVQARRSRQAAERQVSRDTDAR